MKTKIQPKKRGRPVGSKTKRTVTKEELAASMVDKATKAWSGKISVDNQYYGELDSEATVEQVRRSMLNGYLNDIEEKTKPMSLVNKITWVLTAVNVAILISLVIKNI